MGLGHLIIASIFYITQIGKEQSTFKAILCNTSN